MKTLKKIFLVCFLIGGMLTSALILQGHAPEKNANNTTDPSNQPYISAGDDATICNDEGFKIQGVTNLAGKIYWISSGDGTFKNPHSLKTFYIPGKHDIANGQVTLILHVIPQAVTLKPMKDKMVLNLKNCVEGIKLNEQ